MNNLWRLLLFTEIKVHVILMSGSKNVNYTVPTAHTVSSFNH